MPQFVCYFNGVIHLTMLLIDIKILQNRAEKNMNFEQPTQESIFSVYIPMINKSHARHYRICRISVSEVII